MSKLLLQIIILFFSTCVFAGHIAKDNEIHFGNLNLISQAQHEENEKLKYTIDVIFPQFSGTHLSTSALQFNKLIFNQVNDEIEIFKKDAEEFTADATKNSDQKGLGSSLHVNYEENSCPLQGLESNYLI
jgi:hypothetical protein